MTGRTSPKRYKLTITLLEDLHTGTGMGGRGLDSVQAVDRNGLPVLRATHVRGVLRASAEELVLLDPADAGTAVAAKRLFGTRGRQPGSIVMTSFSMVTRDPSKKPSIVWSSTERQKKDRSPRADTLRSVEFIPARTQFEGHVLITDPSLAPLFERCLKRTDRLGSSRTRGAGLVKIETTRLDMPEVSDTLRVPETVPRPVLRLILRNLDPLCLPTTGNPGNIIPSECYIRGQVLLGALGAWAWDGKDAPKVLFDRSISVGNAYPLPASANGILADMSQFRVHPIPLSIHKRKSKPKTDGDRAERNEAPWWAFGQEQETTLDGEVDGLVNREKIIPKPKRPKDTEFLFQRAEGQPWIKFRPTMGVHMRNQVPRRYDPDDEGQLFATTEIAENTRFLTDIHFPDRGTADRFVALLAPVIAGGQWLTIGRGGRPVEVEAWTWMQPHAQLPVASKDGLIRLTLNSDLIARSKENLAFHDGLDAIALEDLTGIQVLSVEGMCEGVDIRGFNAASGLPRATMTAIRRGSDFQVCSDEPQEVMKKLQEIGFLGERTWEGFGRFVLNWAPIDESLAAKASGELPLSEKQPAPPPRFRDEEILERSRQDASGITENDQKVERLPSRSQWQSLRQRALVASTMKPDKGFQVIAGFLEELKERRQTTGGKAWKHAGLDRIEAAFRDFCRLPPGWDPATGQPPSPQDFKDACLYLDTLVRWILPKLERS